MELSTTVYHREIGYTALELYKIFWQKMHYCCEISTAEREKVMSKKIDCPDCKGLGEVEKHVSCERCNGTGEIQVTGKKIPCPPCKGLGKVTEQDVCGMCLGDGYLYV